MNPSHPLIPKFDRYARPALIVACVMLMVCGLGFNYAVKALNIYLRKLPVPLRGSFDTIPTRLGEWVAVGKDQVLDDTVVETLGTRFYLDRNYALNTPDVRATMNVHIDYYTGMIDAVPHVPERCLEAAGFIPRTLPENMPLAVDRSSWQASPDQVNLATSTPYQVIKSDFGLPILMPVGDLGLRTAEYERGDLRNLRIFAGYLFIANGRTTPSPYDVRKLAFMPSEKYAYYCKVQFTSMGPDLTQQKFLGLVSDLLGNLLPELMQRLPDWSEVEHRTVSSVPPQAALK